MNRWLMLMAAVLAASSCVFAEEDVAEATAMRGPSIICDEPNFDFGSVDSQAVIDHTFVFRNVGDTTLEITQVRPACGCTVAEITERNVPPGGESRITARLSMQGRTGHQSKSITIHSNDPEKPQYRVNMSGIGHQSVRVSPERLMLGQLSPGQEVTHAIDVTGLSDAPFNVLSVNPVSPDVTTTLDIVEAGKHYRVNITTKGSTQPGPLNTSIRILTDHPGRQVIDLPVSGNVVGELIYAPAELVLPEHHDGNPLTRYIVVRPGAASTFEITKITPPNADIRAKTFPFGNQGFRIQLENIVPTADLDGQTIVIETTAAHMPHITIPIRIAQ